MNLLDLKKQLKTKLPKPIFNFLRKIWKIFWKILILPFEPIYYKELFLDRNKKIVFIVLSKNACSSIKATFFKKKFKDDYSVHYLSNKFSKRKIKKEEKDYFKFAVVRNPFCRIYSCYKNKMAMNTEHHYKWNKEFEYYLFGYLKNIKSFKEFIKKIKKIPFFLDDRHFNLQYYYIYKMCKIKPDEIIRFENLKKEFEPIRKKFKLKKLPHFNKSQNNENEWKNNYTKELVEIVYKKYKKDFDLWYPNAKKELLNYLDKND